MNWEVLGSNVAIKNCEVVDSEKFLYKGEVAGIGADCELMISEGDIVLFRDFNTAKYDGCMVVDPFSVFGVLLGVDA